MDFKTTSRLDAIFAKEYAEDFLKLLVIYKNISASEAASRLNLHISTAQDFLEGLNTQGIVTKREVFEKKRPYFRYTLKKKKVTLSIDLETLYDNHVHQEKMKWRIREKKDSGAIFKTFSRSSFISSVHFFFGEGRSRTEKKITLTKNQGQFLFYLPFPTEPFLSVADIVKKADIEESTVPEVLDILDDLLKHNIIEKN
jgi:predicted transcriptional regulator